MYSPRKRFWAQKSLFAWEMEWTFDIKADQAQFSVDTRNESLLFTKATQQFRGVTSSVSKSEAANKVNAVYKVGDGGKATWIFSLESWWLLPFNRNFFY